MKKVFGSRAGNAGEGGGQDSAAAAASPASPPRESIDQAAPPDETTRLLPNRIDSNYAGYLSPDDPAVSPYNLFSVRAVRYFSVFLLTITSIWWVLLLVSLFVTPPGFETRGSPFAAFSYASVAVTGLIVSLLFFAAPSKSVRILSGIVALLLFVNTIVTASVQRTRHEEGWVGITSVAWAFAMSIWAIIADRTVQWGKREEEQRLTGRPETRRTLLEWIEVSVESIALLILCVVAALLTCTLILRSLDAGLAPLGKRYWVDGDKYQIHVYCHGSKSKEPLPTVLFEGGDDPVENGLWQFAQNAVQNGTINRYCFADRPGLGWVCRNLSLVDGLLSPLPLMFFFSSSSLLIKQHTDIVSKTERYCTIAVLSRPGGRGPERSAGTRRRGRTVGAGRRRFRVHLLARLLLAPRHRDRGPTAPRPSARGPPPPHRFAGPWLLAVAARHPLAPGH